MKISIAEVKRRLQPGVEYIGEFVGTNRLRCAPGMAVTRRQVVKCTPSLQSVFLDGPKEGHLIYGDWNHVTADERDGSIYLTMDLTQGRREEYLKITLLPREAPADLAEPAALS